MANLDQMSVETLKTISAGFAANKPQEVLRWALTEFHPDIVLACSFGAEDVALVDLIARINPNTPIFYLDTDLLFAETYAVRDALVARYGIKPTAYQSALTLEAQVAQHGEKLYEREPDRCCQLRKVEPLARALQGRRAWITGIRREQSPTRAHAEFVEWDKKFELVKVNPLVYWTNDQVWSYIRANNVPYNPLHDQLYPSIGCLPCTRPVKPGEDPRAGRWSGFSKTECGLHK